MSKMTDAIYDKFAKNLEAVNGGCVRTSKQGLGQAIAGVFREAGIQDACVKETPLLQEADVAGALRAAGMEVYTDHIRLHAEAARGGVSENQYGIAELGTLVQGHGVIKGSAIVEQYDDMFDLLSGLPELPNFIGFMTGPSRTADIECVTTVGVHGPIRLTAVVVDDE